MPEENARDHRVRACCKIHIIICGSSFLCNWKDNVKLELKIPKMVYNRCARYNLAIHANLCNSDTDIFTKYLKNILRYLKNISEYHKNVTKYL